MSRRRNLVPTVRVEVHLPEDLYTRMKLQLFSELEQKVPLGAYQEFFSARLREYFAERSLDLAPWANTTPNCFIVRGLPQTLEVLKRTLKGEIE